MTEPRTTLLDRMASVRTDLLSGRLTSVDEHLAAMEEIGALLGDGSRDIGELRALRAEAERNREILLSAAAGVRAALRRLGEASGPAAIYAADGRKVELDGPRHSRETRA